MFPAFVNLIKDKDNFIHLIFFPGITNENNFYYKKLDLSDCGFKYTENKYDDGMREFVFENKTIISVICKLIKNHNKKVDIIKLKC